MLNQIGVKGILLVLKFATFPYILFVCIWLWSSSLHTNIQYENGQSKLTTKNWSRQTSTINQGQLNDTRMAHGYPGTKITSADLQRLRMIRPSPTSLQVNIPTHPEVSTNTTIVSPVKTNRGVPGKGYRKVAGKLIYSWLSDRIEKDFQQSNKPELTSRNQQTIMSKKMVTKNQSTAHSLSSDQLKSDGLLSLGASKTSKTNKYNWSSSNYRWQKITNNTIKMIVTRELVTAKPNKYNNNNFLNFLSVNSRESQILNDLKVRSFYEILTKHEIRIFRELLEKFTQITTERGLSYFLYSGSLLGSYRHHGMIPWDDDIDVIMNSSLKHQIQEAFSNVYPQFQLYSASKFRWKFYSSLSQPIKRLPWAWPFIDISFFEENTTHIWDEDPVFSNSFCFEKSTTFPLTLSPFSQSMHPAPKNILHFLSKTYNVELCQTTAYSHKTEQSINYPPPLQIPCSNLMGTIPWVSRKTSATGTNETLLIGNKTLSHVFILDRL